MVAEGARAFASRRRATANHATKSAAAQIARAAIGCTCWWSVKYTASRSAVTVAPEPIAQLLADLADGLDARLQARVAPSPPLHVVPDHVGGWSVRRDGTDQPLSQHDSATAAEGAAVRQARATGAPEVLVHDCYDRIHRAGQ